MTAPWDSSEIRYRIDPAGWLPRYDIWADFKTIPDYVRYGSWTRRVTTIWGRRRAARRAELLKHADQRTRRILDRRDGLTRLDRR